MSWGKFPSIRANAALKYLEKKEASWYIKVFIFNSFKHIKMHVVDMSISTSVVTKFLTRININTKDSFKYFNS